MKIQLRHTFEDIISLENLCAAWEEFVRGKRDKPDVQAFARDLTDNLSLLHEALAAKSYRHGGYERFAISDPKPRVIHKASVRDRLVHHAVHRVLYPFFDRLFIADSFSCRLGKGTHKALDRFRAMARKVSRNHTRTCWVLKCDIRRFFASIDHEVLLGLLREHITDRNITWLLEGIISSFPPPGTQGSDPCGTGLPLGNLTSQLFANVYLNAFDQAVKHELKVKHYLRYADDFALLSDDRSRLVSLLPRLRWILTGRLVLTAHPDKIFLKTFASGVDFLGWVHFPDHRVPRKATERRMMRRLREHPTRETLQSYFGLLGHGNASGLRRDAVQTQWLWAA